MAATATTAAMASASSQKKPWRYYYVMAFPLRHSVAKDKLTGMLELTDAMERREEAYLLSMADRDPAPPKLAPQSPLLRYANDVLRALSMVMGVVALVLIVCVYGFQVFSSMASDVDPRVIKAAYIATASVAAQNAVLLVALQRRHALLLRAAVMFLSLSIGSVVFLMDEMDAVLFSQQILAAAINQPLRSFSGEQLQLVLNGGTAPSLWHRFFVDGPAWFLLWLESHCVVGPAPSTTSSNGTTDDNSSSAAVDANGFFSRLWRPHARECTRQCLTSHLQLEKMLYAVLTAMVVVLATQLLLSIVLIATDYLSSDNSVSSSAQSATPSAAAAAIPKRSTRRATRRGATKAKPSSWIASLSPISFTSIVRVASLALVATGVMLIVVSVALLTSCSFVGPVESWSLALVALFGGLQIVVVLCATLLWRERLTTSALVGGLALESYVASALTELCVTLGDTSAPKSSVGSLQLRDVYDTLFQQSCQPLKHWRLHVCVLNSELSRRSPHVVEHSVSHFDTLRCQREFSALLRTTAQHALVVLWWMMAAQAAVLLSLLLPSMQSLAYSAFATVSGYWTATRRKLHKDEIAATVDPSKRKQQRQQQQQWKHTSLALSDAKRLYLETLRRKDQAAIDQEARAFDTEWDQITRSSSGVSGATHVASSGFVHGDGSTVMIFTHQFEAIVRTLVLRRLTQHCKLDLSLSLSHDGTQLFVKIFASDNLLMATLCQCASSHQCQLTDAIDPGWAFWRANPREMRNDAKVMDAHTIHQKLKLLLLQGAIAGKDANVFPRESLSQASARVQALLRIQRLKDDSGPVCVVSPASPFVDYVPHAHLQYLFKKYPNRLDTRATAQSRRAAVLRTIDCLRLTRQILESEFDLDRMQRSGLIRDCTELHSASRLDFVSRASLLQSWMAFWKPPHLPGEVDARRNWLLSHVVRLSPFRQPLEDVRSYFGECIAFYFAWLALYNQFLLLPALAAAILLVTRVLDSSPLEELLVFCQHGVSSARYSAKDDGSTTYTMPVSAVTFGLGVVVWGVVFAKSWERRSAWHQLQWGMSHHGLPSEADEDDRANFRGTTRRNPATQQLECYFPGRQRLQRQFVSLVLIMALGSLHVALCWLLVLVQGLLAPYVELRVAVFASLLAIALLMLHNGDAISALSNQLSEWENHQRECDFQRNVIAKVSVLQAFNSFAPLLLVAFGVDHAEALTRLLPLPLPSICQAWSSWFQQRITIHVGAVVQLQALLLLVFVTRITSHLVLMVLGLLQGSKTHTSSSTETMASSVEDELSLQAYRGCYEDYTEIVVQLGLVVMFSSVFPFAAVFAFFECALELRLDALDLCLFLQRPTPERAQGIGPWATWVKIVLQLGIVVNLALLYFMAANYTHWRLVRRVGAFLASVMAVWLATELLWVVLLPSQSQELQEVRARHAFVVDRYFGSGSGSNDDHQPNDTTQSQRGRTSALSDIERRALEDQHQCKNEDQDENDRMTPAHLQERLRLLRRLNVAQRKTTSDEELEHEELLSGEMEVDKSGYVEETRVKELADEDHAVIGYFTKPASSVSPPPSQSQPHLEHAHVPRSPPPVVSGVESQSPPPPPPPSDATSATVGTTQYPRTSLTGMQAIHVATERDRFDFAQDTGWQKQDADDVSSSSPSSSTRRKSLSERFSLFTKRRTSIDETTAVLTAPPPTDTATATTTTAIPINPSVFSSSSRRRDRRHSSNASSSGSSSTGSALPVVQLSGLEAVHEATRRSQLDFSADRT